MDIATHDRKPHFEDAQWDETEISMPDKAPNEAVLPTKQHFAAETPKTFEEDVTSIAPTLHDLETPILFSFWSRYRLQLEDLSPRSSMPTCLIRPWE